MKKIRIETKSGLLVKEFEGHIQKRSVDSDYVVRIEKGADPSHGDQIYVCTVDFITMLGFIVKEIEVEDRTPVKRWQWIFKEGHKYGRSEGYYTEEEANNFGPKKFIRKIENSLEEFEE